MKIETKFNSGDVVWRMDNNKPIQIKIVDIHANYYAEIKQWQIDYSIASHGGGYPEYELFSTKEELLASL